MRLLTASLLAACLMSSARGARADETRPAAVPASRAPTVVDPDASPAPAPPTTSWYGVPMIVTDALALTLYGAGVSAESHDTGPLLAVSLLTYGLVGPVVHLAHGRGGIAAADFGIRLLAPIVGGIGAFAFASSQPHVEDSMVVLNWAVIGFGAGMLGASAIDVAVLSFKTESKPTDLRPVVAMMPEGSGGVRGTVGVAAAF